MVLTHMLIENVDAVVIDVETVFLYGWIEEEIYSKIPQGYKEVLAKKDTQLINSLLLKQALYGVVQAARE